MTKTDTSNHPSGDLALYLTDCTEITDTNVLSVYQTWLSDSECKRMEGFRLGQDRKRFLVSRALIRVVLAAETGSSPENIMLTTTTAGKPTLVQSSSAGTLPDFNLTHTGALCALAINRQGLVGVDMENLDREVAALDIAKRYFRKDETEALERLDSSQRLERFFELWTLKEAFSKKSGLGIAKASLDSVGFDFDGGKIRILDEAMPYKQAERFYRFRYYSRFHIALAYEAKTDLPVTCFKMIPGDSTELLEPLDSLVKAVPEQSLRLLT